jgi:hypothetical protein
MTYKIVCEGCWEIGEGYGFDSNFILQFGDKKISFGFVNESYDFLPASGDYTKEEILDMVNIPNHVKNQIK